MYEDDIFAFKGAASHPIVLEDTIAHLLIMTNQPGRLLSSGKRFLAFVFTSPGFLMAPVVGGGVVAVSQRLLVF